MKIFSIQTKNAWTVEIELFSYDPISHENESLSQIFSQWL